MTDACGAAADADDAVRRAAAVATVREAPAQRVSREPSRDAVPVDRQWASRYGATGAGPRLRHAGRPPPAPPPATVARDSRGAAPPTKPGAAADDAPPRAMLIKRVSVARLMWATGRRRRRGGGRARPRRGEVEANGGEGRNCKQTTACCQAQ